MNGSSSIINNNNIFSTLPTNNLLKRRITIIRNDSGYGFTLSKSILYASLNNNNDYQVKQVTN